MNGSLDRYRLTWDQKPLLRRIYNDIYDRIAAACVRGTTLEIGGGIGQFKSRFPDVIATDIQSAPWLDLVTDAQKLPFAAGSVANIVMVDVLHHIEFPLLFLQEAERVLAAGGRLVMAEPAITWGSSLFYRLLHHEPVQDGRGSVDGRQTRRRARPLRIQIRPFRLCWRPAIVSAWRSCSRRCGLSGPTGFRCGCIPCPADSSPGRCSRIASEALFSDWKGN